MITIMEPNKVKYSLGAVSSIETMTFGEPGHRTFRLDVHSGAAYLSLWMEKEQLFQLGVYLKDMVGRLSPEDREKESDLREEAWSGGELTIDFKASQMLLSHDQDSRAFYLQAYERQEEDCNDNRLIDREEIELGLPDPCAADPDVPDLGGDDDPAPDDDPLDGTDDDPADDTGGDDGGDVGGDVDDDTGGDEGGDVLDIVDTVTGGGFCSFGSITILPILAFGMALMGIVERRRRRQ